MLKKYEKLGSFEKAYENMKALVDYRNSKGLSRPLIEWKYLLFNWNDRRSAIERAIEMAREAHVDAISFWPTGNPFLRHLLALPSWHVEPRRRGNLEGPRSGFARGPRTRHRPRHRPRQLRRSQRVNSREAFWSAPALWRFIPWADRTSGRHSALPIRSGLKFILY